MNNYRKTATIVGVLYIIGTVAGILSVAVSEPVRNEARYLVDVSANANQVTLAALFVLLMGLALALVPVVIFPILIMFHLATTESALVTAINLPILLQEMVMAVWLIARGFNPAAIANQAK